MVSRFFYLFFIVWLQLYSVTTILAQSNDPQSTHGFGLELSQANTNSRAMGGIAQTITDFEGVNLINPASYGYVYKKGGLRKIALDIGYNISTQNALQNNIHTRSTGTNINNISLRFPLHQGLGLVLALQPQSITKFMQSNNKTDSFTDGSSNQALLGLGYSFSKFSTGLNISYLFGKKQQTITPLIDIANPNSETQSARPANPLPIIRNRLHDFYQGLNLNWGVIFAKRLNVDTTDAFHTYLKWGASLSYTPMIRGQRVINRDILSGNNFFVQDTIRNPFIIQNAPLKFGTGISLNREHLWLIAAEFNFSHWRNFKYADEALQYQNTWQINLGGSFIPYKKANNSLEYSRIKLGASIGNFPLLFQNHQILQWSITAGLSAPIKHNSYTQQNATINLAFEYVNCQASTDFQVQIFNLVFGITLNDLWFLKSYQN